MTSSTVHDMDLNDIDTSDWSERNDAQVDWIFEEGSYSAVLEIPQDAGVYTWCVYLYMPDREKSSTWSDDTEIRLKH